MEHEDFRSVIDEEIARLPARYRSVIVLCCMEGASDDMAAHRLRCPVGTIHSRLHRARERLRIRLKSRGLTLGVGTLAAIADGSSPGAAVSRGLRVIHGQSRGASCIRQINRRDCSGHRPRASGFCALQHVLDACGTRGCVGPRCLRTGRTWSGRRGADRIKFQTPKTGTSPGANGDSSSRKPSPKTATLEERYHALEKEFEAKNTAYHERISKVDSQRHEHRRPP